MRARVEKVDVLGWNKSITLLYHLYIEYEIYNLAYNKRKIILYESLFIDGKMDKWGVVVTFLGFLRAVGH